jgi:hypothetical protein
VCGAPKYGRHRDLTFTGKFKMAAFDSEIPEPDVKDGIEYWNTQPASLDGVLGSCYSQRLSFIYLTANGRWIRFWGTVISNKFPKVIQLLTSRLQVPPQDRCPWISSVPSLTYPRTLHSPVCNSPSRASTSPSDASTRRWCRDRSRDC